MERAGWSSWRFLYKRADGLRRSNEISESLQGAKVSHSLARVRQKLLATISSDENGPRTGGFPPPLSWSLGGEGEVKDHGLRARQKARRDRSRQNYSE